jgi:hypothetical protein
MGLWGYPSAPKFLTQSPCDFVYRGGEGPSRGVFRVTLCASATYAIEEVFRLHNDYYAPLHT